jgi:23S rRNA pseudouridine1911/1915/1917 synthase
MIVAKNVETFAYLKEQFKKRRIKKQYIALVYGAIEQPHGFIDMPIGRNKDGQFVAHPKADGKKLLTADRVAKTKYEVLEYVKDYTLLLVTILTGRTHQIRAHLSGFGHPILGDLIYKPKKKIFSILRSRIKVVDPGRIFLHATLLGFKDPTGVYHEYTAPLPPALGDYLNRLKVKS